MQLPVAARISTSPFLSAFANMLGTQERLKEEGLFKAKEEEEGEEEEEEEGLFKANAVN